MRQSHTNKILWQLCEPQLFGVNSDKESEGAEPCCAPALNDSQSLRSPNCQSPKSVQYPQCHF